MLQDSTNKTTSVVCITLDLLMINIINNQVTVHKIYRSYLAWGRSSGKKLWHMSNVPKKFVLIDNWTLSA